MIFTLLHTSKSLHSSGLDVEIPLHVNVCPA